MPTSTFQQGLRVLVTGGAGFIGSHLVHALCQRGAQVIVLDDFSTGEAKNLAAFDHANASVELVHGSVTDAVLVKKLTAGCTWVFHHAAVASVPQSVAHPLETHEVNLNASLNLLNAARDAGVKRFVFASSSAIYGDSQEPLKHEGLSVQPITPYGLHKYASERYGQLFHQLYGLETVALRYFNVFGPRQSFNSPYSGVIARFCTQMLAGQAPVIFGDGGQSRDFVYIDDVVQANLLAAEQPAVAGGVFNIAGGVSVTLLDLVQELNRLTQQNITPQHQLGRAGDIRHSAADLTLATAQLGYRPGVSWQQGLENTLAFYR